MKFRVPMVEMGEWGEAWLDMIAGRPIRQITLVQTSQVVHGATGVPASHEA